MKIGELKQHCGDCLIIDLCAEPFNELCICTDEVLESVDEEEYIKKVEEIRKNAKRNWSNKTLKALVRMQYVK